MSYPRVIFNVLRGQALLFAGSLCVHPSCGQRGEREERSAEKRTAAADGIGAGAESALFFSGREKTKCCYCSPSNMGVDRMRIPVCIFHAEREGT